MTGRPARYRITANLFGIPFGLAGLAQCWTIAGDLGAVPRWPAQALWVLAAAAWLVVTTAWFGRLHRPADLARELADPTFGPFVALAVIVPMLLGGDLARYLPNLGHVVFAVGLLATLLVGGWLTGTWIVADMSLQAWHPGYFLPTVAGGLVAAAVGGGLGDVALARVLFGYGVVCWIVLGSIIMARLFTQPALPPALRPTLAIEMAPPVVAGVAWFRIDGVHVGLVGYALAGYALLMALVQVRLIPFYRGVPFGPGWWAFSFSYAATVAYCIEWAVVERVAGLRTWTWALLAVATAGVGILAVRTVIALVRRRFLAVVAVPAPGAPDATRVVRTTGAASS